MNRETREVLDLMNDALDPLVHTRIADVLGDMSAYSEDQLLGMVMCILAEPDEMALLDRAALQAINNEFILRGAKKGFLQ
jgi:hypothetical protein